MPEKPARARLRKQVEAPLEEIESLLQSFFESPGIMRGIVEVVDDTTIRHILDNQEAAKFLGLPQEKLRNKLSSELGEPPEVIRTWVNAARESRRTGKPVTYVYLDTRRGQPVWVSGTVTSLGITPEGKLRYIYVIIDIKARKEAEQKLAALALQNVEACRKMEQQAAELESRVQARTAELKQAYDTIRQSQSRLQGLFENMAEGVILFDVQGRVLKINKAAGEILAIDPAVVEGTYYDSPYWKGQVLLPGGMTLSRENLGPFLQSSLQRPLQNMEVQVRLAGGDRRWLRGSMAPLVNELSQIEGIIITFADITAEKELHKERERLSLRLLEIQEDERKRIAYELHDDTAQYLGILKMQIGALADSEEIRNPAVQEKLRYLEKDADRAFNDVRRYSHELRPVVLEHQGLVAAIEQMADDYNTLEQLPVEVNIEGKEPYLTENVRLSLFRIAQEAISNTRKHAQASRSVINLGFQKNRLSMTVSDDGNGFDVAEAARRARGKGSLGLLSMQERARLIEANLKIDSKPGQGTVIQVDLPL